MKWSDPLDREERIRETCHRLQARLLALRPGEATGSATVHFKAGVPKKIEWRILEDPERWGEGR